VSPVFSNFGELVRPTEKSEQIALIRPPASSENAGYWDGLRELRRRLGEIPVIAVGKSPELPEYDWLTSTGIVDAATAGKVLTRCKYAYFDYADRRLAKSGAFAALAAHRISVVLARSNDSSADGLFPGVHYVTSEDLDGESPRSSFDRIGDDLWGWYEPHSLAATAEKFLAILERVFKIGIE
jgi:hypothetical protein